MKKALWVWKYENGSSNVASAWRVFQQSYFPAKALQNIYENIDFFIVDIKIIEQ